MAAALACLQCGAPKAPAFRRPWCAACGGLVRVPEFGPVPLAAAQKGPRSIWRWEAAFPLFAQGLVPVSLGEGPVPLEALPIPGLPRGMHALREDLQPTGSWKDRGSALVVAQLAHERCADIVEDSSGNAGLSLAHYARRAGIRATLFVPATANPVRMALIRAAGGRLIAVEGPRDRATAAALEYVQRGAVYASHVAQPLHALGAGTAAFDIAAALGRVPQAVLLPCGQGGYLTGLARGFAALAGSLPGCPAPPRLVGVQTAGCAPVARAFLEGAPEARPWENTRSGLAEGVLCPVPARAREALAAAHATGGAIVTTDDFATERALRLLWLHGFRVEPTSALPVAWLLSEDGRRFAATVPDIVVILTGAGIREGRQLFEAPA